jgi:LysM repeat protein
MDDVAATRPVPSYRAVPPSGSLPTSAVASSPAGSILDPAPATAAIPAPHEAEVPPDDIPVIRSIPAPRTGPAVTPPADEDWMAPPPWLRQPTGPVWVPEAVPPPDALADVGTQSVRRPRPADPRPADARPGVVPEAAVPMGEPAYGMSGTFSDDTTGMPPEAPADGAPRSSTAAPAARILEATGTGTQQVDPGVSAELAASRYRADVAAGYELDEADDVAHEAPRGSRQRRVPADLQASAWLGSQPQARPSTKSSTGSREWEGPRRFEAYAATQRRRPPTSLLVGGAAIAIAVLLLGVFLLPGMLMGGAAATSTPAATEMMAGVASTDAPPDPTFATQATERPEKTPKPKSYTVKSGDTLIKIAKRFKVSVAKLTCMNRIKNPNNVAVGRTLTIPPRGYRCPRD